MPSTTSDPMRLAELRERGDRNGWTAADRVAYAGALLEAGRVEAAALALRVEPPAGAFVRYPEAGIVLLRFDPRRRCLKCGDGDALVRYVPDRLERTCRRCGWRWAEAPLCVEEP